MAMDLAIDWVRDVGENGAQGLATILMRAVLDRLKRGMGGDE
jgi:hypothetical protein